ncbi:MAG TPA: trypsin-like peptidase domain-containing protein [Chthoniobacteraceae bacterium]|jgi:hypothetical protein
MNQAFLTALFLVVLVRSAVAANFATEMMEATFKLDTGGENVSTCILVRREAPDAAYYLVSTAHTFHDIAAETVLLVLRKPKPDGSYERHDYTLPLRRGDQPLWVGHEKHDVAVLRISEELPVAVAALPASAFANEARIKASALHLCSQLFVLGYPMRAEADTSGLPLARHGICSSSPRLPVATHPVFLAACNLFPGDSGGPVFVADSDDHPLVVGIVSNHRFHDVAMKSVYQEHSIRTPLGIVEILHAQHIRDTVDAAARQSEAASK